MLLIGGEAGAGKTVLLRRFADLVRPAATILVGHCEALSTPRALGPLFDIADAEPALHRLLIQNVPRDQLFHAVLNRLASDKRPIVVAIEDAH